MSLSDDNPVVKLCAAGMAREGEAPAEALKLFEEAWAIRTDDFDASVAAHYVARHQTTPEAKLHWNQLALDHALRIQDDRAFHLMASLYLNVGASLLETGEVDKARNAADRAATSLIDLPPGGYRDLVASGIERLQARLAEAR